MVSDCSPTSLAGNIPVGHLRISPPAAGDAVRNLCGTGGRTEQAKQQL